MSAQEQSWDVAGVGCGMMSQQFRDLFAPAAPRLRMLAAAASESQSQRVDEPAPPVSLELTFNDTQEDGMMDEALPASEDDQEPSPDTLSVEEDWTRMIDAETPMPSGVGISLEANKSLHMKMEFCPMDAAKKRKMKAALQQTEEDQHVFKMSADEGQRSSFLANVR